MKINWNDIVGEGWANLLQNVLNGEYTLKLMDHLVRDYQLSLIYPSQKNVFRAFRICPLEKTKVIILGQDPYHDGSATGLAFANHDNTITMSPSLAAIRKATEDVTETIILDFDVTLEEWAEQGVLLLNTALTVKKHTPTSHSKLWHPWTKMVISEISAGTSGLHWCFWGNHAKGFADLVSDQIHYKYFAKHPVAHVYSGGGSWECDHFSQINQRILEQTGQPNETISW